MPAKYCFVCVKNKFVNNNRNKAFENFRKCNLYLVCSYDFGACNLHMLSWSQNPLKKSTWLIIW